MNKIVDLCLFKTIFKDFIYLKAEGERKRQRKKKISQTLVHSPNGQIVAMAGAEAD